MSCSDEWDDLPAWGTAPTSRFWLAIEQNGSWGSKALVQSALDVEVGRRIGAMVDAASGHVVLVRNPLEHAAGGQPGHRVYLSGGPYEDPWIGTTVVDDVAELLDPLAAWLATPMHEMPGWLEPCDDVLLVCTNGKRDQCCAVKGRPAAIALAREFGERVWEASHLGGHRFAATALALPSGQMFARIDEAIGRRAIVEGTPLALGPEHERGRTSLTEPLQVADVLVRGLLPADDREPLVFDGPNAHEVVHVTHPADDRTWHVEVGQVEVPELLRNSCAKGPVRATVWTGRIL